MPYPALTDRRIPYDNDGTLNYQGTDTSGATSAMTSATAIELQDEDYAAVGYDPTSGARLWNFLFFPEQREVTAFYSMRAGRNTGQLDSSVSADAVLGSNDTANGVDGTWETASLPSGIPTHTGNNFDWRSGIKPVSFTGPKQTIRVQHPASTAGLGGAAQIMHIYGEAAPAAMTHDLVFINHDDTPGAVFQTPENFGDQPLGTTVVRQWRLKNTSATKTATNINIQCNDAEFAISTDGITWVVTIAIASLGPGAESATMYVRCTTPAPGAALGPRFGRIIVVTDAGFFG